MMDDKRMELLSLLSPGSKHAARAGVLATDLGLARRETERLIAQLQALGFQVVAERGRIWIDWPGWPHAKRAAEAHLAHHPDWQMEARGERAPAPLVGARARPVTSAPNMKCHG